MGAVGAMSVERWSLYLEECVAWDKVALSGSPEDKKPGVRKYQRVTIGITLLVIIKVTTTIITNPATVLST